jgi:hypothetical protein
MYADLTVPSRFLPFPHGSCPFSHGSVTVPVLRKHLQILVEPQTGASFSFSIADRAQAHSYYIFFWGQLRAHLISSADYILS